MLSIKIKNLLSFMDPSTVYCENMIKMYNYVWCLLVIVLVLVIYVLVYLYIYNHFENNSNNIFSESLVQLLKKRDCNLEILNYYNFFIVNKFVNLFYYKNSKEKGYLEIYDLTEYKGLELGWCSFPTIILGLIIWPSFSLLYSLDPALDPILTIKVIGHQWYWSYEIEFFQKKNNNIVHNSLFFDSIMLQDEDLFFGTHRLYEVDNRLVVPMGVPIRFVITSVDVLHSWALPSFGLKVDAIPGRLNQYITIIKRPGVFYGQCSELCGAYHGFMPIVVEAISMEQFLDYVNKYYHHNILN